MGQWSERYKNHPLWQILQTLGPAIDTAFSREGIDAEALDGLARLKAILTFVGRRLAGADPYLFQVGTIDALSNSLQAIITEIQGFTANGNIGHINNANSHGDAVLTYLAQLNVLSTTEDYLAVKEAAEQYRSGLENALKGITAKSSQLAADLDVLRTRFTELNSEVTAERTRLTNITSDFQTQFSAAQESRNVSFANDLKERQDRFAALITDFTQKLTEQNAAFTKQGEEIVRIHENEIAEFKKQFADKAAKQHEEILQHKADVEKLVGVIGNLGVTSGYLTTANSARKALWIWQSVTVTAMLALIFIAYEAFLPVVKAEFSWPSFAGRVFVALTVGALAAYAGSQADKYQKMERYNRRLALELEAIGPYIAPLSEDKQSEFRIKVGERSFGQGEGVHSDLDGKSPTTVADVITDPKLRAFIIDIIKATKP